MSSSEDDIPQTIKLVKRKKRRIPSQDMLSESLGLYSQRVVPQLIKINEELQHKFNNDNKESTQALKEIPSDSPIKTTSKATYDLDLTDDDVQFISEESPIKIDEVAPSCLQGKCDRVRSKAIERKRKQLLRNVASVLSSAQFDNELNQSLDGSVDERESEGNSHTVVKVRFQSTVHKFPCQKNDTFASIFEELARRSRRSSGQLLMTLNDQRIVPTDTPLAIDLSVADIIDCVLFDKEALKRTRKARGKVDCITIHFQCKFEKTKKSYSVNKYEPLKQTFQEYAEAIGYGLKTLSFQFDGDTISDSSTPEEVELESDYCIDVMRKCRR